MYDTKSVLPTPKMNSEDLDPGNEGIIFGTFSLKGKYHHPSEKTPLVTSVLTNKHRIVCNYEKGQTENDHCFSVKIKEKSPPHQKKWSEPRINWANKL